MTCNFQYEEKLLKKYKLIAGIDEAGRGALAGPVVVGMVILNPKNFSNEINDSKLLSPAKREKLAEEIKQNSITYTSVAISHNIIDQINIYQSTIKAVEGCYHKIKVKPDYLLLDCLKVKDLIIPQKSLIGGDKISFSIAAASIIAKTTRDEIMRKMDQKYPQYGFAQNKGYGVKFHLEALKKYGISPIHRLSFAPMKSMQNKLF